MSSPTKSNTKKVQKSKLKNEITKSDDELNNKIIKPDNLTLTVKGPIEKSKSLFDIMEDHFKSVNESKSFNPYTLTFNDAALESEFKTYFIKKVLLSWHMFSIVTIILIIIAQCIIFTQGKEFIGEINTNYIAILNGVCGLLPLCVTVALSFLLPKRYLKESIHYLSMAYVIILGPIIICCQYFIVEKGKYTASSSASIYVLAIFSCVFFFRIRYWITLPLSFLVLIPFWFAIFPREIDTANSLSVMSVCIGGVSVILTCLVISIFSFKQEKSLRFQFLSDKQFLSINRKLNDQLSNLMNAYSCNMTDLDSPLEKAIYGVKMLMASSTTPPENIQTLQLILTCLNSTNILTPDLNDKLKNGDNNLNEEEKKWILNEFSGKSDFHGSNERQIELSPISSNFTPVNHLNIALLRTEKIDSILLKAPEFDFPIFEFLLASKGRPLTILAHNLIVDSGLLARLGLSLEKFMVFLDVVESGYDTTLAYHNSVHATDVLHCVSFLCKLSKTAKVFSDLELLAIFVAAIVHDVDHPGLSNNFLIATNNPKAVLYNDRSVLENHHCSTAFIILRRPECNFLQMLDMGQFRSFRAMVVEMVLATDLAHHFALMSMFKKKVLTPETFNPAENKEDKSLVMQMLMKCSDVSNPTKPWNLYQEWIERITTEFLNQGDREKELGLTISPFCNRENVNTQLSQKSFINFIVSPLFDAVHSWMPLGVIMEGLEENKIRFCKETEAIARVHSSSRRTSTMIGHKSEV